MLTRTQCRAARAGLNWSRQELGRRAQLAPQTIADFERGNREPHNNNKRALMAAFETAGVVFRDGYIHVPDEMSH